MLTSLDFLNLGQEWPPKAEADRLTKYNNNRLLWDGEHMKVFEEYQKRIERVLGSDTAPTSYGITLNYHKLVSCKTADLLFGEYPTVTIDDGAAQNILDQFANQEDIWRRVGYVSAIDLSRYGESVLIVYRDSTGPHVRTLPPHCWFPVVSADDIQQVQFHVLAWVIDSEAGKPVGEVQISAPASLRVQIHTDGWFEEIYYSLSRKAIGKYTIIGEMTAPGFARSLYNTGLKYNAVLPVINSQTSDSLYGQDDYDQISSLVAEMEIRYAQIAKVLDAHSSPSMAGPESALSEPDENGMRTVKAGNYFTECEPIGGGSTPQVRYLIWDASMDANFKLIEELKNQLYTLSEMGGVLLGDMSTKTGNVPSGSALKRMLFNARAKIGRMQAAYNFAFKRIFEALTIMLNTPVSAQNISITWGDGLPDDEMENAQIINLRTGGASTLSRYSALKRYDRLSEADIETELEMIDEDKASNSPIQLGVLDQNNLPGEGDA